MVYQTRSHSYQLSSCHGDTRVGRAFFIDSGSVGGFMDGTATRFGLGPDFLVTDDLNFSHAGIALLSITGLASTRTSEEGSFAFALDVPSCSGSGGVAP